MYNDNLAPETEPRSKTLFPCSVKLEIPPTRTSDLSEKQFSEIFIFVFYTILGWSVRGSVGAVSGPVRRYSADPARSGGPRTGGQCFRVTPALVLLLTFF